MAKVCKDSVDLEEGEIQEQGEDTNEKQNKEKNKRKSRKEKRRKKNDEGTESKRMKTENERHQHKKRETQNEDKVQYEMRNDKTHRDRKRDGKDRGQHHSKDKTTSNLPNDLTFPIRRLLCSSGGSMELGRIADAMGLTLEQIERFVEYEEGRSIMLRKEGNSLLAVSRSAVRMCTERTQKCNGDCEKLHLCRYFLMGKCNRHPCAFSHDIHDHHNMKVLNLYELQELDTDELRQLLIQNDPSFLPKVCKKYNEGPVSNPFGNCAFEKDCQKLHVCQFFLSGNCKFNGKCKRPHSFTSSGTPEKLEKWGLSTELLPKLKDIYRNACALGDCWTSLLKKKHPTCVEKDTYQENQHISEQIKYLRENEIPSVRYPSMDTYGEEMNDDMPIQESYKNGNRIAEFKKRDMEESNMSYKSRRLQKEAENYEIRKRNVSRSQSENDRKRSSCREGTRSEKSRHNLSWVDPKSVPEYWDTKMLPRKEYKLISLDISSDEYNQVKTVFHNKLPSVSILSIERLQYPNLWNRFQRQKNLMKERGEVKEQKRFYATSDLLFDTCLKSFQCGSNGTIDRQGICFVSNAYEAHIKNTEKLINSHVMFMACVLLEDYTSRNPSPKSRLSSSCIYGDATCNPTTSTLLDKGQIYPEYIIKYL